MSVGVPDLSKEASDVFIWCLAQNSDAYKQWVSIWCVIYDLLSLSFALCILELRIDC